MPVFICWSGPRSHLIAKAVKRLLNKTVPALENPGDVFVSDSIEKGVAWFDSIVHELNRADAGVVCLTSENVQSPWMHFEAGALARKLSRLPVAAVQAAYAGGSGGPLGAPASLPSSPEPQSDKAGHQGSAHRSRLFTVLHGVTTAEIRGPLGAYQGTSTTRREMGELVRALRLLFEDPLPTEPTIPDDAWRRFESALGRAVVPARTLVPDLERLFQRKTFNEPLHQCADQAWLARYEGARSTREHLQPQLERIKAACPVHEQGLFEMLLNELDSYGMAIQALLLTPKPFRLGDSGELQMDPGIRTCCEDRRLAIRSLAGRLLNPLDDPLLPEAVRFMAAETNEERKMIVHRLEGQIRREREETYEDVFKGSDRQLAVEAAIGRLTRVLIDKSLDRNEADEEASDVQPSSQSEADAVAAPGARESNPAASQPPARLLRFRESSWDLDRIYYYLLVQYFDVDALRWEAYEGSARPDEPPRDANLSSTTETGERRPLDHDLFCAARDVEMEVERYRAKSKGGSLMPLMYALGALQAIKPKGAATSPRVQDSVASAVSLVERELGDDLKTEPGRPIARLLEVIG